MILYINGDSHSAGAELARGAVDNNLLSFKGDDSSYWRVVGTPEELEAHPACIELSYGATLAKKLNYSFLCDAVPGGSNARIHRRLKTLDVVPDLIIIGWSTWEREEVVDPETGRYWQMSASGVGHDWPDVIKYKYKEYISNLDWDACAIQNHHDIFQLHKQLQSRNIPHLFFNTYSHFKPSSIPEVEWDGCYIDPYSSEGTYFNWCKQNGFKTVSEHSYHYGKDAHDAWANYLYTKLPKTI